MLSLFKRAACYCQPRGLDTTCSDTTTTLCFTTVCFFYTLYWKIDSLYQSTIVISYFQILSIPSFTPRLLPRKWRTPSRPFSRLKSRRETNTSPTRLEPARNQSPSDHPRTKQKTISSSARQSTGAAMCAPTRKPPTSRRARQHRTRRASWSTTAGRRRRSTWPRSRKRSGTRR
ncbi:hypothetical protein BKA80DRAFT_277036 [Phyllosticta citrichinensis]